MKFRCHFISCFLGAFLAAEANGQFYAPDVCLHDAAQRLFVGEAARVHAWIENRDLTEEERIATVSWEVSGETDGKSEWVLVWKDARGTEKRRLTVGYEGKELERGADWYRSIWRQLRGIAREKEWPEQAAQSKAMLAAFWEGGESAGTTRMEGLLAAMEVVGEGKAVPEAAETARLAGILSHSSVSMLAGACMLDGLNLARAAAWICHTEEMAQSGVPLAWAPVIYLGGRERLAAKLWSEAPPAVIADAGVVVRWWNRILKDYPASAEELVLFAAEEGNAERGLPFLMAHLRMESAHRDEFNGVIQMLYNANLERWPDAGSSIMKMFGVNGSQGFYSSFPVLGRVGWLQTIGHVASPEAGGKHPDVAAAAVKALTVIGADSVPDRAIRGLEATAELLERGYDLAAEAYEPVAVVTVEDLLVHGWDMTLESMHAWYTFLNRSLGVQDAANEVFAACRTALPTLMAFLEKQGAVDSQRQARMSYCEEFEIVMTVMPPVLVKDPSDAAAQAVARNGLKGFFKRSYLVNSHLSVVSSALPSKEWWNAAITVGSQAGEAFITRLLAFLQNRMAPDVIERLKAAQVTLAENLERSGRNAISARRSALQSAPLTGKMAYLEAVVGLERLYWQAPESTATARIFDYYLKANAKTAAKRFYEQSRDHGGLSVGYSNEMPPRRWVVAWWERDAVMMATAARDVPSFSARDLHKQIIHALAVGKDEEAQAIVSAYVERYPRRPGQPEGMTEELQRFLPLLPALKSPDHAQHGTALDFFAKSDRWVLLRLVLARRFALSAEKTLQLLGNGMSEDPLTKAVVAHVQGDKEAFEKAYAVASKPGRDQPNGPSLVLLECLRHDLLATPEPKDQPDLKPERVVRLDELVRNKLKARR